MVCLVYGQTPSRTLRFVGNNKLPPIISEQHGDPVGLAVDLAKAVAEKAHLSIRVEAMDWSEAQSQVLDHRPQAATENAFLQNELLPREPRGTARAAPRMSDEWHIRV